MDERTEPGTKPEKALHHMHTDTINIFWFQYFISNVGDGDWVVVVEADV